MKNIKITKSVFISIAMSLGIFSYSQPPQVKSFLPKITAASPEASAIAKYGNYNVNLYSGLPDISIPIYEIKAAGISIPISISYHASGIKVTDAGSWVGLGWSLNAGGMITRKIMGKADEQQGNYLRPNVLRTNLNFDTYEVEDLNYLHNARRGIYDTDPDIFSYTLPGKSGKFVFNQRDNFAPFTIPYDPIKISKTFAGDNMTMDVTDESGVDYKFNVLENTISCTSDCPQNTSAWKLSQIVSANKQETIDFNYSSNFGPSVTDVMDYVVFSDQIEIMIPECNEYTSSSPQSFTSDISVFTNEKYLQEIKFPNGKVTFETSPSNRIDIPGSKILDAVKVFSLNSSGNYQLIKTVKFYHDYFSEIQSPGQGRLKLTEIATIMNNNTPVEKHSFLYNEFTLPNKNIRARDYWGYYNGKNNDLLIPRMNIKDCNWQGSCADLWVGSSILNGREPDENYMKACTIRRIYYPTGGYSDFEFEANKYLDNDANEIKVAGGLRIKTITNYDGFHMVPNIKTYKYGTNELGYGRANFILKNYFFLNTQTNRYFNTNCDFSIIQQRARKRVRTSLSNSSIDLEPYDGVPVGYATVTEYDGDGSGQIGKTVYTFTDMGDVLGPTMVTGKSIITSYHFNRGLLASKSTFKKTGSNSYQPVSETTNSYGAFPQRFAANIGLAVSKNFVNDENSLSDVDFGPSPRNISPYGYSYDSQNYNAVWYSIRTGDNKLSQTSNTLYDQNNPAKSITTVTDYFYDNFAHQQVTRIETKSSSQDVIITTKKYPPDFGSVLPYSNMTTLNIINKVIEERKTKNGATLSLEKTNYKNWNNNNYLPESIELQIKNNPIQTRATFNNYDLRGNIVEMQKENDVKTTYLWGYNKTYPVAQVVGADYATVSGLVDQSVLDNPLDEQTMKTQLNNLRNSLSIKNALVTTYTYKPLLGITSQTDANGRTVYYEYDAFGRLKVIKNHDGEIIKQYDYKYGQ